MPSASDPAVLIVGAGPTGLVLALWLTRLGIRVRIIDKLAEAGTTSRALAVQARTLESYRQLKIADVLVERGVKIDGVNLWARSRKAARIPLRNLGAKTTPFPFPLVFPQDEHERLLIERLRLLGVAVERPTELVGFTQDSDGVHAKIRKADGTEENCPAAFLAGCDGARSAVRQGLNIGFPGGTYEGLFYVADVQARGPATDHELHVDLDASDLLLVFPMKGQGRIRLVGSIRDTKGKSEHDLRFADVSTHAIEHLKLQIEKVNWFSTYRVHHRVANNFRQDRVFLLGDAAHIHSPAGGQGMNTGIGDAVNLAWKLAEVVRGRADLRLLDTYEPERIAFARRLVATTDRGFTVATARGWLARIVRTRLIPAIAPLAFRFPGARSFLFRTVSQIGVRYRQSPLSEGATGKIRAGDRLPWVETGNGEDNFAPLESLAWQAHFYGQPPSGAMQACERVKLPVHIFSWSEPTRKAGLKRGALYLIRPDGYVGLVDDSPNGDRLSPYLEKHHLRTSSGSKTD